MNSLAYAFELSQAERLELASCGTPEPTLTNGPRFPYAPLRESIKARAMNPHLGASRYYDEDDGETSAELASMGEDEEENERAYSPHVLPSGRNRSAIRGELRSMGYEWND